MKVRNAPEANKFTSNIATPHGKSLCPALLTKCNWKMLSRKSQNANDSLQLAFADDVGFVSSTGTSFKDEDEIEKLADVNLHVNNSRTEKSENEHWQKIRKVCSRC